MMSNLQFDLRYPSVDDLRNQARKRMPGFAFEYLDGGCNEGENLKINTRDIRKIKLTPYYLNSFKESSIKKKLFGKWYDAPFGIAPIGLQGLMWPNAPEILAKAAYDHNIPFILSTVTTSSIERIADITDGHAWFQLYHPTRKELLKDLLRRLEVAGYKNLVVLCDVPTFGFRPNDFKNGLGIPPKMSLRNMIQILSKPSWSIQTLIHGIPQFKTLKPYMKNNMNLQQLGSFMDDTFSGRLNEERIKFLRDEWKGNLILKGVSNISDARKAIQFGFNGIIISNHGGRQLDAAESSISSLEKIRSIGKGHIEVMMDSGIRSGPDIARSLAMGADFTFLGRSFMYGIGALGKKGGHHTISMLKIQLQQVLDQLCCEKVQDLPNFLINK